MEKPEGDGSEAGTGIYVTELGPDDVLLGRGTGPSSNEGNVNFRNAVEAMKSDYVSTASRKAKNKFVRKTVEAIKAKNGRFLSKLRKSEVKMLGMPAHKAVYEVVRDDVAFEKTKQAIRYVHYKKDAPPAPGTAKRGPVDEAVQNSGSEDNQKRGQSAGATLKNKDVGQYPGARGDKRTGKSAGRSELDDFQSTGGLGDKAFAGTTLGNGVVAGQSASANMGGPSNAQALLPRSFAAPAGQPTLPTISQPVSHSGSIHQAFSETVWTPNASSNSPPQSVLGGNSLASPGAGGYPFLGLPSLPLGPTPLQNTGLRNISFPRDQPATGSSTSLSSGHANSSESTLQSGPQSQSTMSSSSNGLYNMLLTQSLPGNPGAPSATNLADELGNSANGGGGGIPSGLFQQALQNEQLRSILLSDQRYRQIMETLFQNNNRS